MILPEKQNRSVLGFLILPNLAYEWRLVWAFAFLLLGFFLQGVTRNFFVGAPLLLGGTLLLLVGGYHNRVEFGSLDPEAHWEPVPLERLDELLAMDKKMVVWDRSWLDFSNPRGFFAFLVLVGFLVLGVIFNRGLVQILFLDGFLLLIPHWVTGQRRLLRVPKLLIQVKALKQVLDGMAGRLSKDQVTLHMLLRGGEAVIPENLKIKVDVEGHSKDFLGLYGQVVLNAVQGRFFPYFYVVLVAKKGFGLSKVFDELPEPSGITKEFKVQDDVEVLVIRQHTTKTSGYHTKLSASLRIFGLGLDLAEKVGTGVLV